MNLLITDAHNRIKKAELIEQIYKNDLEISFVNTQREMFIVKLYQLKLDSFEKNKLYVMKKN